MVHCLDFASRRLPFTFEYDGGPQRDLSHCELASTVFSHYANCLVAVTVNQETAIRGNR
jgi:hypothetical protein